MADVKLKDSTGFVVVVGSAMEAAQLRAQGYTDVVDEPKQTDSPDAGQNPPPDATPPIPKPTAKK